MGKEFNIHFHMRTASGLETFARFQAGADRETANKLFDQLLGNIHVNGENVLLVELLEKNGELPVDIRMKSCTLEELGYNCKLITRENFRWYNMNKV